MSAKLNQSQSFNKLQKRIRRDTGKAVIDYSMIEDGDRIMVCMSGGKDSYTMLDMLMHLQKVAPIEFSLIAVNLDQKQPGFPEHVLPAYFESIGIEYKIIEEDTYSIVVDKIEAGKTTCSLCSRLRRGILYQAAKDVKATKIALGHHRDDMLETLFLNMFYGGRLKSMPPKLLSDNGEHTVIRPLAYCNESDIKQYSNHLNFPIIPCNLCGSQENLQRKNIKSMLEDWQTRFPGRIESMAKALQNVVPSHLADGGLFDFNEMRVRPNDLSEGDTAFDPPTLSTSQKTFIDDDIRIIELK